MFWFFFYIINIIKFGKYFFGFRDVLRLGRGIFFWVIREFFLVCGNVFLFLFLLIIFVIVVMLGFLFVCFVIVVVRVYLILLLSLLWMISVGV